MPFPFVPRYAVLDESREHILVITFNRPKAMNSMPSAMHAEMSKIIKYFDTTDDLWVAIVTGNGKAFSAGFDLKSAAGLAPPEDTTPDLVTGIALEGEEYDCQGIMGGTGFAGLTDRQGLKPVIAAVNGIAHGGGFETALSCDVIIAGENADFALPEPKVGLYAAAGGVGRLPRLIGYHNALAMILTGRRVKAHEAKELGICQQVVPGGNSEVLQAALDFAEQILLCSPDSIQASLGAIKQTISMPILEAIKAQMTLPATQRMFASPNVIEGK
jgi:crotonobetainyl-CoA hydratase